MNYELIFNPNCRNNVRGYDVLSLTNSKEGKSQGKNPESTNHIAFCGSICSNLLLYSGTKN